VALRDRQQRLQFPVDIRVLRTWMDARPSLTPT
jgi:hypothetical protein